MASRAFEFLKKLGRGYLWALLFAFILGFLLGIVFLLFPSLEARFLAREQIVAAIVAIALGMLWEFLAPLRRYSVGKHSLRIQLKSADGKMIVSDIDPDKLEEVAKLLGNASKGENANTTKIR